MNKLIATYQYFQTWSWVQKLLAVVVAMLVSTFIFRLLTPELAPVQTAVVTNTNRGAVNLQNIEFRGNYPNPPDTMSTATVEYTDVSEELLQNLLTAFSIPPTESEGIWTGPQYQIVEVEEPFLYVVSQTRFSEVPTRVGQGISTQLAIAEATKIIDGLYSFGPKPEILLNEIIVTTHEDTPADGGESAHETVTIPFAYTYEGVPIYIEQETNYAAYIVLNSDYALEKAEFRPYTMQATREKSYSTIKGTEALGRINQNEAGIVFSFYKGPRTADFSNISSGVLYNAQIEYRADLTTNTLTPYYNFVGIIENAAGYDIETEIVTPALKTDFSSNQ
ncbi:MAG: hypothetical protein QG639_690 [Patescibacteria group bacterium]|nr:hypothetical protein [Patescibacteria group bacterium]